MIRRPFTIAFYSPQRTMGEVLELFLLSTSQTMRRMVEYGQCEAEMKIVKRTKAERSKAGEPIKREENQMATLCKQITDYNQLILLLRNETSRLQSKSIR